ncbi:MAG TPA: PqqD family protein [Alphaproteobacteria bacterium]|nr:PqqD family protein [Alphaproteobacteria bacterium]
MSTVGGRPLDRAARIRRSDRALATEVGGEMVMMDVEQGVYFGLDAIGTDIWKRLETPVSVQALAAALAQDYDAPVETIERDVLALLASMAERGLVEVC